MALKILLRISSPFEVFSNSVDVWVFLSAVDLALLMFAFKPSMYSGSLSMLVSSRPSNTTTTSSWTGVWSRVEPMVAFTGVTFVHSLFVEKEGIWQVVDTFGVASRLSMVGMDSVVVVGNGTSEAMAVAIWIPLLEVNGGIGNDELKTDAVKPWSIMLR